MLVPGASYQPLVRSFIYIYILGIYNICNIFSPLAGEHDDHENDREHQLGEFLDAVASGAPYLK